MPEIGIIGTLISVAENAPAEIKEAEAVSAPVIAGLKEFVATPLGQQVEGWLMSLFGHSVTPDAVTVVVPKAMT